MPNCSGGYIEHVDGTIAGCTLDDDIDGCVGLDERHEDAPVRWLRTVGPLRPLWDRAVTAYETANVSVSAPQRAFEKPLRVDAEHFLVTHRDLVDVLWKRNATCPRRHRRRRESRLTRRVGGTDVEVRVR